MHMSIRGNSEYQAFRETPHFSALNGVRAVCALIVIKEHSGWRAPLPQLFEWGFLGVDMFFVISGFLIVTLLLRERDDRGTIDLRSFYIRRTLRIFPIYYLVIGLLFLVAVATYSHSHRTWETYKWSLPVFMIYAQDLIPISLGLMYHTWSLAMEEQFYLLWPSVERFANASVVVPIAVVLIVISQACNFGIFSGLISSVYGSADAVNRPIFLITFTPILLGVLAAHAMHTPAIGRRLCAVLSGRWMPAVLLLAAIVLSQSVTNLQGVARLGIHVIFCLLLLSLIINRENVFTWFLDSRPMVYVGTISYGLYLYHTFVIAIIQRIAEARNFALAPWEVFIAASVVTLVIAGFSFKHFEKPIIRSGARPNHAAPKHVTV